MIVLIYLGFAAAAVNTMHHSQLSAAVGLRAVPAAAPKAR
jgi:hypothetical protein